VVGLEQFENVHGAAPCDGRPVRAWETAYKVVRSRETHFIPREKSLGSG
jgi:hypothetical protein